MVHLCFCDFMGIRVIRDLNKTFIMELTFFSFVIVMDPILGVIDIHCTIRLAAC